MAFVQVAKAADADLVALADALSLPADTKERVKRALEPLASFPQAGQELGGGHWEGLRCLGGPWRWMLIIYEHEPIADVVTVLSIQDARTSAAAENY